MARILAYTSPALGHLFPLAPILLELQRRGHTVALRTLAAGVDRMRDAGLDAAAIDPRIEAIALDDYLARSPAGSIARSTAVFAARAAHEVPDLRRAIDTEGPDVVVADINTWGAMAAAEAWGGPWAAFCPYPIPLGSPDAPPFGLGLPPARGPLGRLRDAAVRPLVMGAVARATLPKVASLRRGLGLAPFGSLDELQTAAPLLLYLTAEPFEYPRRDWPASYALVGPSHWEPPHAPLPWLEAIDRPVVLVTTSSEYQDDGRLVRTAFEALAREDVFVVATLPSGETDGFEVPANARLERFVPHGAVLPRAACAVTHGGMGATQKALAHGVPVCAVPFGRDQFEVARRVEVAGAGTRLPATRLAPERLRRSVREAIARRPGAERIARAYREAGGAVAAADAVERRLLA